MRISLFYNFDALSGKQRSDLYHDIEAQTIVAERLGFDAIWLTEQHFEPYSSMPSPLLYLARLSSLTRRIGLGTAVVETAYYHPLRLAEDIALLDIISKGRVRLGIGAGPVNTWFEFAHFATSLDKKTARMLEMVAILRQAFDKGYIDFLGNYYQYEGVELQPRPLQSAQHLLWITANNATPESAGVAGYNLLVPNIGNAAVIQQFLARYRMYLNGKPGFVAQLYFIYVASCEREAQEQMRRSLTCYTGYPDNYEYETVSRYLNVIIGTPSQVAEQLLARQQEYGLNEVICQVYNAGMQHEEVLRSITLLGEEVLPRLRSYSMATILD